MIPEARALTFEEHEELIKAGLDPAFFPKDADTNGRKWAHDLIKFIMPRIYPDFDFAKEPSRLVRKLALDTFILTVEEGNEGKNS